MNSPLLNKVATAKRIVKEVLLIGAERVRTAEMNFEVTGSDEHWDTYQKARVALKQAELLKLYKERKDCPKCALCIFSYSDKLICCTNGKKVQCCQAFSGMGVHRNNPNSQRKIGKGPTPEGEYLIGNEYAHNGDHNHRWFRLYGKKNDGSYARYNERFKNRNQMNLHSGSASIGCVTCDYNDENKKRATYPRTECFDKLADLLMEQKSECVKDGITGTAVLIVKR